MSYNLTGALQGGNVTLVKAGLTGLSGAATTFSTNALTFAIGAKVPAAKTFTTAATPTTDASTGVAFKPLVANQVCVFLFGVDAGGNAKVAQGQAVPWTDTSANSTAVPFPSLPDTVAPFGYAVIKAGSTTSGNWTFGSSNWNATGIVVDTPVDIIAPPSSTVLTA